GERHYIHKGFPLGHVLVPCPYGEPGDRLWVRETWAAETVYDSLKPREIGENNVIWFRATDEEITVNSMVVGKWRPSIFMCRWMSRINLTIKNVRAERIQDISNADAKAEGCYSYPENYQNPIDEFRDLWNSINSIPQKSKINIWGGKEDCYISYPWENIREIRKKNGLNWYVVGNPYVWDIEFQREVIRS
ncbi:MAG: hypothetical protein U9N61_10130, partial [Euryarchaeota archaeon]|nr:hypothetical protein [Euryarchaeota archaeon]